MTSGQWRDPVTHRPAFVPRTIEVGTCSRCGKLVTNRQTYHKDSGGLVTHQVCGDIELRLGGGKLVVDWGHGNGARGDGG